MALSTLGGSPGRSTVKSRSSASSGVMPLASSAAKVGSRNASLPANSSRIVSSPYPRTRRIRVNGNLRLFTFIQSASELSNSSSIQGPRFGIGMMLAVYLRPSVAAAPVK